MTPALLVVFIASLSQEPPQKDAALPPPSYIINLPSTRTFASNDRFRVTDFRYSLTDGGGASHLASGSLQWKRRGFFHAQFREQFRSVEFEAEKWSLQMEGGGGALGVGGSARASTALITGSILRRPRGAGTHIFVGVGSAPSDQIDIQVQAERDSDQTRFPANDRTIGRLDTSITYKREPKLEASLTAGVEHLHTRGGVDLNLRRVGLATEASTSKVAAGVTAEYVDTVGRFPSRETRGEARGVLALSARFHLDGVASARHQRITGPREYRIGYGASFFARKSPLPRAGESARRAVALARTSRARGVYQRPAFGFAGTSSHRELRRREAWARDDAFRGLSEALYAAEMSERPVPLMSVFHEKGDTRVLGTSFTSTRVSLSVPRPRWSWRSAPEATVFLTLSAERRRDSFGSALQADTEEVRADVELNREIGLGASWSRTDGTPTDRLRGVTERRILKFEVAYMFGR